MCSSLFGRDHRSAGVDLLSFQFLVDQDSTLTELDTYFRRCCFARCLLISFPTTLCISSSSSERFVECENSKRPSRSRGSGWKNKGLLRWSIWRCRNLARHAAIHPPALASRTTIDLLYCDVGSESLLVCPLRAHFFFILDAFRSVEAFPIPCVLVVCE